MESGEILTRQEISATIGSNSTAAGPPRKRDREHKYGSGSVYRRGRIWHVAYYCHGRAFRESSGSERRDDAEKLLAWRLAEIRVGHFHGPEAERLKFDDLAKDLLLEYRANGRRTLPDVERRLKLHLLPYFGGRRAVDITNASAQEYILKRRGEGASEGTIWQELALLRHALRLAVDNRKLREASPIKMPKLNNVRKGFIEYEQYRNLRDALPEHLKPLLAMGYFTGMRLGEIRSLDWNQVDWLNREVRLEPGTTKNDEGRTVPLVEELFEILRIHHGQRGKSGFVFQSLKRTDRPVRDFRRTWQAACVRAGLGSIELQADRREKYVGLTFHDLRRSGVMNMERSGVARSVAMKISGHKTESTYRRYAIVSPRDLRDAAAKLDRYLGERSASSASSKAAIAEVQVGRPAAN